jgi:hypothetical protein
VRALPLALPLLLSFVALAGCSSDGDPEADALAEAERAAAELQVEATDTTGVIRGVVVDQAVRPLAGALVVLANSQMNATTSEAGVFAFEGLEAGTYFLTASLADYTTVQQSVDVIAGVDNPEAVKILLAAIPRAAPAVVTQASVIFISGSGWLQAPSPVGGTGVTVGGAGVLGDGNWNFEVEVAPNGTIAQTELIWDMTTPLGENGRASGGTYEGNDGVHTETHTGPSPLVMRANATEGTETSDNVYYSFYAWPIAAAPFGFQFNQKVDVFVTVFYNFMPSEGWTFVEDGPYPVPEK